MRDHISLSMSRGPHRQQPWGPGRLIPQLLGWGTNNVLVPQLFGGSFQKARNFTAKYAIQCSLQSLFIMDQDDVLHAIYMFHNFHLIGFWF